MSIDLGAWATTVPSSVVERLGAARRVLAVTHENPDADTIAAALALAIILEARGVEVAIASEPVPPLYRFFPGIERVRMDPDVTWNPDLLVVLDCGSLDRVGTVAQKYAAFLGGLPRLIIDHHVSSDRGEPGAWIEPHSAATCEMLALLAVRLGIPLTAADGALASVLMAGIVMDTATFAHSNATPRTLAVSAALVEAGAPLSEISRRLYRLKADAQLRLFGRVLARLETLDEGRVIWSTLLDDDLAVTGAVPAHSEGIIDLLSQAESAEVALLFKEQGSGTRLSVRTRAGGVDAIRLVSLFGGGGHARAAGATIDRTPVAARAEVLAAARRLAAEVSRDD